MAGDWIKMRPSLLTSPRVNGIARFLEDRRDVSKALSTGFGGGMSEIVTRSVMRYVTVTGLLSVWGAANEHTSDGVFRNADLSDLDDMAGIPGFGEAMASVGWASYDAENECVSLPNFEEYNTCSKERSASAASNAERQRRYRERKKASEGDVDRCVMQDVTRDVSRNRREEKRREEELSTVTVDVVAAHSDAFASPQPRGTRLSADWLLPRSWGQWALDNVQGWTDAAVRLEGEKFRDYWCAKSGRDASKRDWEATWRNWIRNARAPAAVVTLRPNAQIAIEERNRAVAAEWLRSTGVADVAQ
jgi:hypothetical protein